VTESLNKQVVIITGASSGIGAATAIRLGQEGARLVLAARRNDRLEGIQQAVYAAGGEAIVVKTDVTSRDDVNSMIAKANDNFGRIDVLINNAGIMPLSYMRNRHVDEWDQMIDVNVRGVLYGIAGVLPVFRKQKSGHIVNVASIGARRLYAGAAVYCATKSAVRALSEGLRMELDPSENIRVTVIEPGAVRTELAESITDKEYLPGFRQFEQSIQFLEPEDVAESIVYAISQSSRINVDEVILMPREQSH